MSRPVHVIDDTDQFDIEADRGLNSDLDHYIRMAGLYCHCHAVCDCDDSAWFIPKETL